MSKPWDNQPSGVMKATVLTSPGAKPASAAFTYTESFPKPTLPGPGWVLVRVRAMGINRAELRSRDGVPGFPAEWNIWQKYYIPDPPKILGEDLAGEVVEAAEDTPFRPGEKVLTSHYGGGKVFNGSNAEYVLVHKRRCYHLPQNMKAPWELVGALGMAFLTAYGAVITSGRLHEKGPNPSIIIHGGSSAVGIFAALVAKDHGATVITTTRQKEKIQHLRQTGADHIILESELDEKIPKILPKGANVVVELIGPDHVLRILQWVARFGTAVVSGVLSDQAVIEKFSPFAIPCTRNLAFYSVQNDGIGEEDDGARQEDIEPIWAYAVEMIESDKWKKEQFVDSVYELKDIGKAHERAEKNEACGRLVIVVP